MNKAGLQKYVDDLYEKFLDQKRHWAGEHILVESSYIKGMRRALELLDNDKPEEYTKSMTSPDLLDALATAYANSLDYLLNIGAATVSTAAIKDALATLDPEWRDSIDEALLSIVEMAEKDMGDFINSGPKTLPADLEWAARNKVSGNVITGFGLLQSREDVQAAIDMTGTPEQFEIVRRGVTKWVNS